MNSEGCLLFIMPINKINSLIPIKLNNKHFLFIFTKNSAFAKLQTLLADILCENVLRLHGTPIAILDLYLPMDFFQFLIKKKAQCCLLYNANNWCNEIYFIGIFTTYRIFTILYCINQN